MRSTWSVKFALLTFSYRPKGRHILGIFYVSLFLMVRDSWKDWQLKSQCESMQLRRNPVAALTHSMTLLFFHRILDLVTQQSMTLRKPLESDSLSRLMNEQKQFCGHNQKKLCPIMFLKEPFWQPQKDLWKRFCFQQSFFDANSMNTLGYNKIALSRSTWADYFQKWGSLCKSIAAYKSSSVNVIWASIGTSSTIAFEGISTLSMNFAKATEYMQLGIQYKVVFECSYDKQLGNALVKSMRNLYCLAERALQSRQMRDAEGSSRFNFNTNLQYYRAALQHPFLPRMSTNLNSDMNKLLENLPQAICRLGRSSLTNCPMLYCEEYQQMQMILWINASASLQLPFNRKNSPMLQRASVWQGFLCMKSNICWISLEFLIDSYSSCRTSYFLLASIQRTSSFSTYSNFSAMGKQLSMVGIRIDFFILTLCMAL